MDSINMASYLWSGINIAEINIAEVVEQTMAQLQNDVWTFVEFQCRDSSVNDGYVDAW